jgi:hypothetical protein
MGEEKLETKATLSRETGPGPIQRDNSV